MKKDPNRFFVYCLFRPWNGEPCYIGKGSGDRIRHHFKEGQKHSNPYLANILKKAGGKLPYVILHKGIDEDTAFRLERELIRSIGRRAHGGPLTNHTDGGEGASGYKHTPETVEHLTELAKARAPQFSEKLKGNTHTRGHKLTAEHKSKIDPTSRIHRPTTKAVMARKREQRWQDAEYRLGAEAHCKSIAQKGADRVKELWKDPEWRTIQLAKRAGKKS